MKHKSLGRNIDSELFLARIAAFGFEVHDTGDETLTVERDGLPSSITLGESLRYTSGDSRDGWLLSLALELSRDSECCETYFLRGANDNTFTPEQIVLDQIPGAEREFCISHGVEGAAPERYRVSSIDELTDALPFLAPTNAIGYHRARSRIFEKFTRLRPCTWQDAGITDAGTIAEYERHRVRPDDLRNAEQSGIVGMTRIIENFGIPSDDEWEIVSTRNSK